MPASEIFIEATETDPDVIARDAVREAHERLRSGLAELISAHSVVDGARSAELVDFCLHEVRRYLVTADRELYAPASGDETRLLIDALRVGAAVLDAQIDELAAADPVDAAKFGVRIAAVLEIHLRIEESVLLPALAGLPDVDPSLLAADVRAYLEGKQVEEPTVIDVRRIARGGRHPRVFARYARLAPGETFVLVNSHDPKPLRREFEAIHAGAFSWDCLEAGPEEWRVRIGRVAADA
ncbi:uncharacterized protein (DUF2249 family) [Kribbella voronezhensis]|uniref:Uncharacterized protein (DUF2249 family) n=1 Tax=Kribbella voronezhensis TaxID=2512212 RepID=A0A4R7T7H1_9ACTN|nr:DUF2249 domain-containing protein [Kribbella voronezhensis]TDU87872.1 uncharacterized protein (DUF2249 family) [Kribbella voronezhensis]